MAVANTDILYCGALNMPNTDIDVSGGAVDITNLINDASIGALFPTFAINPSSTVTWYYKVFFYNSNATDTWYNVRFYIQNGLIPVLASGQVTAVSTSASDVYDLRIIGENGSGVETYEDITLTGTSAVSTAGSYAKVHKVMYLVDGVLNPTPINAYGTITITRGITLGVIPAGCHGASSEYSLALDADVGSNVQTANRLTAPTDGSPTPTPLVFSQPTALATSILSTGTGGDIPALTGQGIWVKWTCEAAVKSSLDIPLWIVSYGMDVN